MTGPASSPYRGMPVNCQISSTAATETASDDANAKPNPITSCAMAFIIAPHGAPENTEEG
jgi:hypothetical protein